MKHGNLSEKHSAVRSTRLEAPRRLLVYAFLATSLWYLTWRVGTFNPDRPIFSGIVYVAEVFGFLTASLHIFMCWRLTERRAPPAKPGITVDVFVPTYNESVALVRKTLLAAQAMHHPHETWLLDDGRRAEMAELAKELGCRYLTRSDNAHAKAGNLNNALAHSTGELVVIFDADHVPRRDFLTKTLGYFSDTEVAFVQTPQDYYNLDSYQHRRNGASSSVWTEQALFFRVIQRGKDFWNAAFFCGSCAVIRRSALERIGGFATGTITEDLHTSIRLHACGFKSVYHAEPLAFGLAPESIEPFIRQRVRWGQGAMHVWRKEGILTRQGLTWAQRLNYLASVLTYFDGWQKGIFYFAPVVVLLTGALPLITSTQDFLLHFLPYYLLTFWVFEEVGRGYGGTLFIEQYNMARFAAFAWATLAWILPRLKFDVTKKGAAATRALRFTLPQWLVMSVNWLAIPAGALLYWFAAVMPLSGLIANAIWAGINGALALAVLSYTRAVQWRKRTHYRFPVPLPARLVFSGIEARGTVDDLSNHGFRFYGSVPPFVEIDGAFTGSILLPDGPVTISGQVRNLTCVHPDDPVPVGLGATFETSTADQKRIERFLFGSNLQWMINGYSDQIHTPLSKLLPRTVAGPAHRPFADMTWNAAEFTSTRGKTAEALVPAATSDADARLPVLSFKQLPENEELVLQVFRRKSTRPVSVTLTREEIVEHVGIPVFAYRAALSRDAFADTPPLTDKRRERKGAA